MKNDIYNPDDLYNKLREFIDLPKSAVTLVLKMETGNFPVIELETYATINDDPKDITINKDLNRVIDKKFAIIDFDDLEAFKEFKKNKLNEEIYLENSKSFEELKENRNSLDVYKDLAKSSAKYFEGKFEPLDFNEIDLRYIPYRKLYHNEHEWYIEDRSNPKDIRMCGADMKWISSENLESSLGLLFVSKEAAEMAARKYFTGK